MTLFLALTLESPLPTLALALPYLVLAPSSPSLTSLAGPGNLLALVLTQERLVALALIFALMPPLRTPWLAWPLALLGPGSTLGDALLSGLSLAHPALTFLGYLALLALLALPSLLDQAYLVRPGPSWALGGLAARSLLLSLLLGAWWAQQEAGWGGWWGWDPVESGSLWFTALALACLHSRDSEAGLGGRPGALLFPLALFLLGIRLGLLDSVHAFLGPATPMGGGLAPCYAQLALIPWVIYQPRTFLGLLLLWGSSGPCLVLGLSLCLGLLYTLGPRTLALGALPLPLYLGFVPLFYGRGLWSMSVHGLILALAYLAAQARLGLGLSQVEEAGLPEALVLTQARLGLGGSYHPSPLGPWQAVLAEGWASQTWRPGDAYALGRGRPINQALLASNSLALAYLPSSSLHSFLGGLSFLALMGLVSKGFWPSRY